MPSQVKAIFLSHGGGPLPLLGDPGHQEMVDRLRSIAKAIKKPRVIVVVSAHWEASAVRITHSTAPPMIYDYTGFPPEAYQIQYPAPGEPALAEAVFQALGRHAIPVVLDEERGFDHGVYVPLTLMYPAADIPCIQLSLMNSLDPAMHIRLGEALADELGEGVLLIGSGFSFHNMRAFRSTAEMDAQNQAFEQWLIDTCSNPAFDEAERSQRLVNWTRAPAARYCHPREEHLLPLHVCYGFAKMPCTIYQTLRILGKQSSIYFW